MCVCVYVPARKCVRMCGGWCVRLCARVHEIVLQTAMELCMCVKCFVNEVCSKQHWSEMRQLLVYMCVCDYVLLNYVCLCVM